LHLRGKTALLLLKTLTAKTQSTQRKTSQEKRSPLFFFFSVQILGYVFFSVLFPRKKARTSGLTIRRSLEEDIFPSLTRPALKENWVKSESYLCWRRLE